MAPKISKQFGKNVEATLQIIYFPLSLCKTQNQKIQTNMPTLNINNTITSTTKNFNLLIITIPYSQLSSKWTDPKTKPHISSATTHERATRIQQDSHKHTPSTSTTSNKNQSTKKRSFNFISTHLNHPIAKPNSNSHGQWEKSQWTKWEWDKNLTKITS